MYRIIGIMSGTSLDGLDVAQCTFEEKNRKWEFVIEKASTFAYTNEWKQKLSDAENTSGLELMFLHNELGDFIGSCINNFLGKEPLPIDFIASHGHTIFHQPHMGLTLQIGNGANIAARTGISSICDFRSLDVALGGQGAPLVPIGDKLLFSEYGYCLNLGGFANISYDESGHRLAYDLCPVNIVINMLVKERGLSYDPEGTIAKSGVVHDDLLRKLDNLEFYHQEGPKSLGKEWVLGHVLPLIEDSGLSLEDKLRTYYQHITKQIAVVVNKNKEKSVLVTGGGAHNLFLVDLFRKHIKDELIVPNKNVIDYKEALIFAFLGLLRFREENNCLKSVTGAKKDHSGGAIYLA